VRGDLDPNGAYLSVLDGQNTLNQAFAIEDSSYITVQDLSVRNFIASDPNMGLTLTPAPTLGIVDIRNSRNITYRHNRNVNLQATGLAGGDFYSTGSTALQVLKNYWMSAKAIIVSVEGASGDVSANHVLRENTIIRAAPSVSFGGFSMIHLYLYSVKDYTVRSNYLGMASGFTASPGIVVIGMYVDSTQTGSIQGNILYDIPTTGADGEAYVVLHDGGNCTDNQCNEKATVANNLFYKASANSSTRFLSTTYGGNIGGCNGSQFFNNAFVSASGHANDTAFYMWCTGTDLSGVQNARVDYNFYSNIAKPFVLVSASADLNCPTSLCASTASTDQHPSTNDQHNSSSSGLTLSGAVPYPYFGISGSATQKDVGSNTWCFIVPSDALCDMGAFEAGLSTTGGVPPWNGQSVVIPTVAGVN